MRTCLKLISEKCGHSIPHDAFLSIEARKSQSIGARNRDTEGPEHEMQRRAAHPRVLGPRFSGGKTGLVGSRVTSRGRRSRSAISHVTQARLAVTRT